MAKPAFIYAFDNLGPYRFTELCGELLGARYNGFMLGGEGADGGIDAEIDKVFGVWVPEYEEALLAETVQPDQTIVFQFKHKVTARVGQTQMRTQLLNLFKCNHKRGKVCELHSKLVQEKKPTSYVLVTNVEVNSQFRHTFINLCKGENPDIQNYQIIGLDDLASWVEMMPELRHLYFPTIFGIPRYNLRITTGWSFTCNLNKVEDMVAGLSVNVLNVGSVHSYLDGNSIGFGCIVDGKFDIFSMVWINDQRNVESINLIPDICLEPGRKYTYLFPLTHFSGLREMGKDIFPEAIYVTDVIRNVYREGMSEDLRKTLIEYIYGEEYKGTQPLIMWTR